MLKRGFFIIFLLSLGMVSAITTPLVSEDDFLAGSASGVVYDNSTQSIVLDGSSLNGYFESAVFDSGHLSEWESFVLNTSDYGEIPDGEAPLFVAIGDSDLVDPVLLMHLNDEINGSGFGISDSSGFLHDGETNGNVDCMIEGRLGNACMFENDSYVQIIQTSELTRTNNLTYSLWINPKDNSGDLINRGVLRIYYNASDDELSFLINESFIDSVTIPSGSWSHVAFSFSDGTLTSYLDGLQNSVSNYNQSLTSSYLNFGSFGGSVDEFAIWNRVIEPEIIEELYWRAFVSLNVSVRSCSSLDCSSETFELLDGSNLNLEDNRYFSFRLDYFTEDLAYGIEVYDAEISYEEVIIESSPPQSSGGGSSSGGSGSTPQIPDEESEEIIEIPEIVEEVPEEVVEEPSEENTTIEEQTISPVTGFLGLEFGEEGFLTFTGAVTMIALIMFMMMWFVYSRYVA